MARLVQRADNNILCEACTEVANTEMRLVGIAAGIGLFGFGVGALITGGAAAGVVAAHRHWTWQYPGGRDRCARCGRSGELMREASPAATAIHTPVSLKQLKEEYEAARIYTEQVLRVVPKGVDDPAVLPHLLKAIAGDVAISFGRHGGQAATDPLHMAHSCATNEAEGSWKLELASLPSSFDTAGENDFWDDPEAQEGFKEQSRHRIAASLGLDPQQVAISKVVRGSVILEFTVANLTLPEKERILRNDEAVTGKLRQQFDTFRDLKISPVVFALHFDLDQLDDRGDKVFGSGGTFELGPPHQKRKYTQPTGWVRYGFKVLGKYGDDKWLHPFQDAGNWYRAFHGTGRSGANSAAASRSIVSSGFRRSSGGKIGAGVYVSPSIDYVVNNGYAGTLTIDTTSGKKSFKFALQVAAQPEGIVNEGIDRNGENMEWTLGETSVRPYGLLIREA